MYPVQYTLGERRNYFIRGRVRIFSFRALKTTRMILPTKDRSNVWTWERFRTYTCIPVPENRKLRLRIAKFEKFQCGLLLQRPRCGNKLLSGDCFKFNSLVIRAKRIFFTFQYNIGTHV